MESVGPAIEAAVERWGGLIRRAALRRRGVGMHPGRKLAELVRLGADPTADIRNNRRIEAVIAAATLFDAVRLRGLKKLRSSPARP